MSNELTIQAGYSYAKNGDNDADSVTGLGVTVAADGRVTIEAAAGADAALALGGLTTIGYGWFKNLDLTNSIKIKSGVSGTVLALLTPARPVALVPFDTSITAPSFQAVAGTPKLKYSLFPP